MKRKIGIISIIVAIIILIIGIIIGININKPNKKNADKEKIVKSSIIISNLNDENKSTISTNDIALSNELLAEYKSIMNNIVLKTCIEANKINISSINNTQCIELVVWFSENSNDDKCIDAVNKSISEFSKEITQLYDVKVSIVDVPEIMKII